jgi:hypothetical protein
MFELTTIAVFGAKEEVSKNQPVYAENVAKQMSRVFVAVSNGIKRLIILLLQWREFQSATQTTT